MSYTEIIKLKKMLEKAKIPFEYTDDMFADKECTLFYHINKDKAYPAHQIIIKDKTNKRLCDAVQHFFSYGNEKDLIEIIGTIMFESDDIEEIARKFSDFCVNKEEK